MDNIGARLKIAIKNSKFSQKEIANIINTSQTTLSTYTQNKSSIPVEILVKICEVINTPLNEIVYGIDINNLDDVFLNKFRKLNDDQKRIVMSNIEFLESMNSQMSSAYVNTEEKPIINIDTG